MALPACELCKRTIEQVRSLHRQNEKGVKGVWRCNDCNTKPVDLVVTKIMDALAPKVKKEFLQ